MPGENNAARDRDYIYGIYLVRFVSAVGVAFYHLIPRGKPNDAEAVRSGVQGCKVE